MENQSTHFDPLIENAKRGCQISISKIWEIYSPLAKQIAKKYLKEKDDIDSAVSTSMFHLISKLDKWSGSGPFPAWARKVLSGSICNWINTAPSINKPYCSIENWDSPIQEKGSDFMLMKLLMKFVEELQPAQKLAFINVAMNGLTNKETAQLLGVTEGTIKSNLSDARKVLRSKCIAAGIK